MPGIDDRLRRDLERLAKGAEATGSLERVSGRRRRHRTARRLQAAALAAVVVAATAGGGYALTRAFRREAPDVSAAPTVRNGKIAFIRSTNKGDVYLMERDGSHVSRLTRSGKYKHSLDWSPDGTRLAFVRGLDVYVMNADGTDLTVIASRDTGQVEGLDWSPDGTQIAFTMSEISQLAYCDQEGCAEPSEGVFPHLHVMNDDGSGLRALTSGPWYEHDPTWSPDGATIVFVRSEPELEGIRVLPETPSVDPDRIYAVAPDGSDLEELWSIPLTRPFATGSLGWSPDGKRFLFVAGDAIYLTDSDGKEIEALPIQGQGSEPFLSILDATWSPDGEAIAFSASTGAASDLFVVNTDGTGLRELTEGPETDYAPAWQPIPLGAPTIEPTPPTATAAPTSPPATDIPPPPSPPSREDFERISGPLCGFSGVFGDFDGDGKQDQAAVAFPRSGEACKESPGEGGWFVYVMWAPWPKASGPAGAWPLPDCDRTCRAFAVADLDGDGGDEFFLVVDEGAATIFMQVYDLSLDERPKYPSTVAPPGADGYPANEPALFPYGGSVTHQDFVTCDEGDGVHILIASSAELDQNAGEWTLQETIFSLEGELFSVVSTRDYQVAYDPSGEEPLPVPGDSCFALD